MSRSRAMAVQGLPEEPHPTDISSYPENGEREVKAEAATSIANTVGVCQESQSTTVPTGYTVVWRCYKLPTEDRIPALIHFAESREQHNCPKERGTSLPEGSFKGRLLKGKKSGLTWGGASTELLFKAVGKPTEKQQQGMVCNGGSHFNTATQFPPFQVTQTT